MAVVHFAFLIGPQIGVGPLSCARAVVDCSWKASPTGTASRSAFTFPGVRPVEDGIMTSSVALVALVAKS